MFVLLELAAFDVVGVFLNVRVPLLGKVIEREDRRNRADWHARAAVDALHRVNEELVNLFELRAAVFVLCVLFRMNAVHWARIHTGRILGPDTGFRNNICHCAPPLSTAFPANWIDLLLTYTLSVEVPPRASVGPRSHLHVYSSPTRSPALVQVHPPDRHPHR